MAKNQSKPKAAAATFVLMDDQQCSLAIAAVDDMGNTVPLPGTPTWATADSSILTVTPNASDATQATMAATGKLGTTQVNVTCPQADPNAAPLTGMLTVQVTASAAAGLSITPGTPAHV
jgi:hypothetical protein